MPAVAELAQVAALELGRTAPEDQFLIEGLRTGGGGDCWCGRSLDEAPRAIRLVRIPPELGSFRGRPFHSCACGVAYASRAVNHIDEYTKKHPADPKVATGVTLRAVLVKLMGQLLAFELTWV
jgi:hypothetical protein